jgi:AraC-like DNA-binding protein
MLIQRVTTEGGDDPAPAGGKVPAGFRLVQIEDLRELEAGTYWPRLQPHFLKPDFKLLRYQILERAGGQAAPDRPWSVRGASGVGELNVAYIADRLAATLTIAEGGLPDYCLTSVSRGTLGFTDVLAKRAVLDVGTEVGLVYRGTPGTKLAAAGDHERIAVWIPAASLHQRLAALLEGPITKELSFDPVFSWESVPAQGLRRLLRLLMEELGSSVPFGLNDLAARSFTDLLLYTLLRAVPHNHAERLSQGCTPAAPAIIRRAEAYIRANVQEPIALHEVAQAAGCSVRSLQQGFQRFREMTPLTAIRHARLEAARESLRSGQTYLTVTELALQFGFTNPGRFTQQYKAAFGESPLAAMQREARGHRPAR